MLISKIIAIGFKSIGKFLNSKSGKKAIATGTVIGVGLAGNGVRLAVNAKKKNRKAYEIQEEALLNHDKKLKETQKIITHFGIEEKKSIELIDDFLILTKKINKCPSMNHIDSKMNLPTINPIELKKMSNGLDMALSGIGGSVSGALPGLVFCGASLSTLGLATISGGVVLSIKGSKLAKKAVKNIAQAKKLANEADDIVEFYKQLDMALIKLTKAIVNVNDVYRNKLGMLNSLVEINNDYDSFSKNNRILVKNLFKLTALLIKICETKLAKRIDNEEYVNTKEIEAVVEQANKTCKDTRQKIFDHVFV
jgi:hypothetical protein